MKSKKFTGICIGGPLAGQTQTRSENFITFLDPQIEGDEVCSAAAPGHRFVYTHQVCQGYGKVWGYWVPDYVDKSEALDFLFWEYQNTVGEVTGDIRNQRDDLLSILLRLSSNPHVSLEDLVYKVRESEGQGWEGPSVTEWSQAVTEMKEILSEIDLPQASILSSLKDRALTALKELVALKRMKADGSSPEEYEARKQAAWAAAFFTVDQSGEAS